MRRHGRFHDRGRQSAKHQVSVFHGRTGRVADIQPLGRLELSLAEALPSGAPNIRVTFAVGVDDLFRISAHDVDRGEVRIAVS